MRADTEAGAEPARRLSLITRLLPLAIVGAAICLFASELMTMFDLRPPGGESQCVIDAADRHHNAQMVIAVFAVIAMLVAVYTPSRPAAIAVAVMGALALLIFLISDLRVVNATGSLSDACSGPQGFLFEVKAVPQSGFWLELAGALALAVTGVALATLTPAQLGELRPARRERPTDPRGPDAPKPTSTEHADAGEPKGRLGRLAARRPRARQRG